MMKFKPIFLKKTYAIFIEIISITTVQVVSFLYICDYLSQQLSLGEAMMSTEN